MNALLPAAPTDVVVRAGAARGRLGIRDHQARQVLGSSTIAFDKMANLDYLYVTSWSLCGDLRTIPIMVRGP